MKKLIILFLLSINTLFSQEILNLVTDETQKELFYTTVEKYFLEKEIEVELHVDYITVPGSEIFAGELGLINLAQLCLQYDVQYWKEIIYSHFNNIEKGKQDEKKLKEVIHDYEAVKKYLLPRLYPKEYFPAESLKNTLSYSFSEDVVITVVYDLPTAVKGVNIPDFTLWNKTKEDVLRDALNNLREKYPPQIQQAQIRENFILNLLISSTELFNTSLALLVDDLPSLSGSMGVIIAIPNRTATATFPVEGIEVLEQIRIMGPIVVQLFREGPASTSYNMFWYYNDTYTQIPLITTEQGYGFEIPRKLILLLAGQEAVKTASLLPGMRSLSQ